MKRMRMHMKCFTPRGFSLVELMIAITIGFVILLGLSVVFYTSTVSRKETDRAARQIENGRYAMQVLSEDLKLAGYVAEVNPNGRGVIRTSLSDDQGLLTLNQTPTAGIDAGLEVIHFQHLDVDSELAGVLGVVAVHVEHAGIGLAEETDAAARKGALDFSLIPLSYAGGEV